MPLIKLAEDDDMASRESAKLNLDALIARQDMESGEPQKLPREMSFRHLELIRESGITFALLRKPDFQRSTSSWSPEKVKDMVVAYLEGETVPGVIVWRAPSNELFVIDGGHRLSSVIAWINDDYGDGDISKEHYGESQNQAAAEKTSKLIEDSVGSYADVSTALSKTNVNASQKHKDNAAKLTYASLKVQELEKESDAAAAEKAFIKINQQGVVLSDTEKWLIHARYCPNAIAARAISLKGTGGAYWDRFQSLENKTKISELGASIYNLLFTPDLDTGELKTVDLPIAGSYTASNSLALIFQFVNFANDVPTRPPASRADAENTVGVDLDGGRTVNFLKKAHNVATLMSNLRKTTYARSADLHPFVYFYSRQGNHQPTMFLATAYWLREMDKAKKLPLLAVKKLRERLEDFLLENAFLIPSISRKVRGEERAVRRLKDYLHFLFEKMSENPPAADLLRLVGDKFKVLTTPEPNEGEPGPGSRISIDVKNSLFIEHELKTAQRCEICGARIPARALSRDHRIDLKHDGTGAKANAAPSHHACNSAKDKIKKLEKL